MKNKLIVKKIRPREFIPWLITIINPPNTENNGPKMSGENRISLIISDFTLSVKNPLTSSSSREQ
jgi:hypothetical protein